MPITGLSFLLFALAAVVLYYLFPKRLRTNQASQSDNLAGMHLQ